MKQKMIISILITLLFSTFSFPPLTVAEDSDIVIDIYNCGPDVLINMQNAGMIAILESEVGAEERNRMLSRAMNFKETGSATGYFDPGSPIILCGIENVKPITFLELAE
jgi:hypothetical protein